MGSRLRRALSLSVPFLALSVISIDGGQNLNLLKYKVVMKTVRIAIATIFQNGGDATRAIEIAKIIRAYQPEDYKNDIIFISRGSHFDKQATDLGFGLYRTFPKMNGVNFLDDFQSEFGELIGNTELAVEILKGEIYAYNQIKPDILIHGFWPIGSIAKRLTMPSVKSIAFLPLPLSSVFLGQVKTFPDEICLSRLPRIIQKYIIKILPKKIRENTPALRHTHIRKASENLYWNKEPLTNIFKMLKSDMYLITDFPIFYNTKPFGEKFVFTGPIYSELGGKEINDARINEVLSKNNKKIKIFCTLGSSGSKANLLEIIKIFNSQKGLEWSGIILSPKSICPIEEAKRLLENKNGSSQ